MIILVNLASKLLSEAILNILKLSYDNVFLSTDQKLTHPDIIIVDHIILRSEIFNKYPNSKVVLLDTGLTKEQLISCILGFKLSGVISLQTDLQLFLKAIKVIKEGQLWISNDLLKVILEYNYHKKESSITINLTEKEREIIEYICKGYRNKQIAERLFLSEQTVKAHINRIFKKLQLNNRAQLVSLFLNQKS